MQNIAHDEDDLARRRLGEMLRVTAKETAEEKEWRRLARECPLKG